MSLQTIVNCGQGLGPTARATVLLALSAGASQTASSLGGIRGASGAWAFADMLLGEAVFVFLGVSVSSGLV